MKTKMHPLQRILRLKPESFLRLVTQVRHLANDYDAVEVDLDAMKVKGDLKVICLKFKDKVFIGKSRSLNLLKRAATAGMPILMMPPDLELDDELKTLVKNRGTQLLYFS